MSDAIGITFRPATLADADAIRAIIVDTKAAAMPWLPVVHTPAEDAWWVSNILIPKTDVTVAERNGTVVGVLSYHEGMVEQLYVAQHAQRLGIGRHLLDKCKQISPSGLRLWCFAGNTGGIAFYSAQGFRIIEETDGSRNEEQTPDLLFAWP